MASAISIIGSALKNFQPDASVYAGGAASLATLAIGAVLVALNVTVPFLGVPLTMGMVSAAAVPIGHLVTSLVPATLNQQLNAMAKKLGTDVETLKAAIPQTYSNPTDYPNPSPQDIGQTTFNNLTNNQN